MIKQKLDTGTKLTITEVGKIVTHYRGLGKRIIYRELTGYSPTEASANQGIARMGITADQIAKAAGRVEE